MTLSSLFRLTNNVAAAFLLVAAIVLIAREGGSGGNDFQSAPNQSFRSSEPDPSVCDTTRADSIVRRPVSRVRFVFIHDTVIVNLCPNEQNILKHEDSKVRSLQSSTRSENPEKDSPNQTTTGPF